MKMNYNLFTKKATEKLRENGWTLTEGYDDRILSVVAHDKATSAVTPKRIVAFLNGDALSKDSIKNVVESVHNARKKAAMPPLFPTTNVLVFVFKNADAFEWILEKAKKRDLFTTNNTVSWIVDLTKGILKRHKGLPMINSGKSEIEYVLSSINC